MAVTKSTKANSYNFYFQKVLEKRLHYIYNLNLFISVIISVFLAIPYANFLFNVFLTFLVRAPIIWLALVAVKQARFKFSTVEYSQNKTFASQIYSTILSFKFANYALFYVVSAYLISAIFLTQLSFKYNYYLLSKEYRHKPLINDEWLFYCVFPLILALAYSFAHLVLQRTRLVFEIGRIRNDQISRIFSKIPTLISLSVIQTVVISLISPLIYWFLRPLIYKLGFFVFLIVGLDTSLPPYKLSSSTFSSIGFLTFNIVFGWELNNHAFNVYSTIGCLDLKKLISTYSSDPINTLLTGLKDKDHQHQLSKLTVIQELAYISSSDDVEAKKLRDIIYNSRAVKDIAWKVILEELSLIVNDFAIKVNYRSPADLKTIEDNSALKAELNNYSRVGDSNSLFGNSNVNQSSTQPETPKLRKYEEPVSTTKPSIISKLVWNNPIAVSISNTLSLDMNSYQKLIRTFTPKIIYDTFSLYNVYFDKFLASDIGSFFRITVKRDTESRTINSTNYANAVLALSNFAINSIDEDKNLTVTEDHISFLLNLFEGPIRASSNYTDFLPASVYTSAEQKINPPNNHIIAKLHDLTISEFYQLCRGFSHRFNGLSLNSKTSKLAKKVIDLAAVESQPSLS